MKEIREFFRRFLARVREIRLEDVLIVVAGILVAGLLRWSLRGHFSNDTRLDFSVWYRAIQKNGFAAIKNGVSNYTPLYLYLLYIISKVRPSTQLITAIKLPSMLCDFLCAWLVFRLVRLKYPQGPAALFSFFAILFAPTVVLNGSFWGQFDILWVTGLVACLLFLAENKGWQACLAFGVAVSIKVQAIFFLPFLAAMLLKRKIPWWSLLLIPGFYLASILPVWIGGRPLLDLLTIYLSQWNLYATLTAQAPNLYNWFPEWIFSTLAPAGVYYALGICLLYLVIVFKSRKPLAASTLVQLALVSVLLVPYFLPKMHDRYFLPADVLSIVYAFYFPELFYVALLTNLVSFFSYQYFLFNMESLPFSVLAIVLLGVIVLVVWKLILTLYRGEEIGEAGTAEAPLTPDGIEPACPDRA
ncbi:MAG: hypothetical protein ABSG98_01050 [Anaerolineales bacterium]|jgi:Gpi18-like mannosyltransferase